MESCIYLYTDRYTGEPYCEILDKPCDEKTITCCPLLNDGGIQ